MPHVPIFTGSAAAVTTPFREDYSLDLCSFDRILEYLLGRKTDAVVVCGTTGESSTLTDEEKTALISRCTKKVDKKIPVIAGTGSNNTVHALELSQKAADLGVDALLLVTPYYNKTTQSGLVGHYSYIAERVALPMIIYNVPSRTGLNILPETYEELSRIPNVVAIKEANGDISAMCRTAGLCRDELDIYSGDDALIAPSLSLGAKGVISVLANVCPVQVHELCMSFFEGDVKTAAAIQTDYCDLIDALFCEVNPVPVKFAQSLLGLCSDRVRLPLAKMSDASRQKLVTAMRRHCLLP